MLNQKQINRFYKFLAKIKTDTYPEKPDPIHTAITVQWIEIFLKFFPQASNSKILDIGCGQGVALEVFTHKGFLPIGITLNHIDFDICKKKGYTVSVMDQNFLDFDDNTFDLIWCRHTLEHSFMPLYALSEFYRVLKNNGGLYVEVPAPNTGNKHFLNQNHYSLFDNHIWQSLLSKSNFKLLDSATIPRSGPGLLRDDSWAFVCYK